MICMCMIKPALRTHNPAYIRNQDYTHMGFSLETLAINTATQKID